MDKDKALREHILELLDGRSAHIDLESALNDFPISGINERAGGSPHTPWELLEHIRIAQRDILDFCRNANYKELRWPDDYWPKEEGTVESWNTSVRQVFEDLQAMRELVSAADVDLYAGIPHGSGQTILREAMLIADHNSYHLGQLVMLRKMSDMRK
jgi:hypothetical protein